MASEYSSPAITSYMRPSDLHVQAATSNVDVQPTRTLVTNSIAPTIRECILYQLAS